MKKKTVLNKANTVLCFKDRLKFLNEKYTDILKNTIKYILILFYDKKYSIIGYNHGQHVGYNIGADASIKKNLL